MEEHTIDSDQHAGIGTVAVTGGTGFVGRSIVRELLVRGWSVRVLARSESKARKVLPAGAGLTVVRGGVLERDALDTLMEGVDACVHLVGIIREAGGQQTFENMHAEASRRVIRAGEKWSETRGEPIRHVQMSALGVRDGSIIPYQSTKYEGERAVASSGLRWTIFRPGLIHGPDGEFTHMVTDWVRGRAAPFLFVPYFTGGWLPVGPGAATAPCRVEDVAQMFCDALTHDSSVGNAYDLAGPDEIPFDDLLRIFKKRVPHAKPLPILGVPGKIAVLQAKAANAVGLGGLLPFDEGMARMAMEPSVSKCASARADLGFDPMPFEEALASYSDRL
ncbi:MAG: NAD(P)H-binding protein [Planctomycetota bacterium]